MLLKQHILFTKQECDSIISKMINEPTHWQYKDRSYDSYLLSYNDATKWIFERLKKYFESETGIEIYKIRKEIHFHKFIKGDWFAKHNDINDSRLYAIGTMLNDDFEGGDFIMYNDEKIILDKKVGNTYIFDVKIEHEITPIIDGERYSLLWFLQNKNIKLDIKSLI